MSIHKSGGPIDIDNLAQSTMQKVKIDVAATLNESEENKPKSKYFNQRDVHRG